MQSIDWLAGLNPEQKQAVLHNEGPQLILAGAGSGKTTVLIARAGRLISEGRCSPENMLILTFTNKAAREIKERVSQKIGKQGAKIQAGTFHSFGLNFLKEFGHEEGLPKRFGIVSQNEAAGIIKEILRNLHVYGKDNFDIGKLQSIISAWKEKGIRRARNDDPYEELCELLLPRYEEKLKELAAVDFDDLIQKPTKILKASDEIREKLQQRLRFLMIDEFQDTNPAQMQLVRQLVPKDKPNLCVVGDDDQSIYGWRGAEIKNILDFPKTFHACNTVKLIRNYRCNEAILDMANHVIRKNTSRHEKDLIAERAAPAKKPELFIYENEEEEAEKTLMEIRRLLKQVKPSEIALLYRSNSQGAFLESYLRRERIPYRISGNTGFFDRKEVRDILSYLHCALQPSDLHFRRILNTPARGIGLSSVEVMQGQKTSFVKAARNWRNIGLPERAGASIDQLFAALENFRQKLQHNTSSRAVIESFLEEISYKDHVRKGCKDADSFGKQWMIVEVLLNVLDAFQKQKPGLKGLEDFLDTMDLRDVETKEEKEELQLLTFHACKGLEFPYVFVLGLEEDLLPHARLGNDVAEERRLFYVAITRAKESLILSHNRYRLRAGRRRPVSPSRFLLEIPPSKYIKYEKGNRPLGEEERSSLVADFLKSLD